MAHRLTATEGRFFRALYQLQRCSHHAHERHAQFPRSYLNKASRRHAYSTAAAATTATAAATSKQPPTKASLHRSPDTANTNLQADLSSHMRHLMRRIPHSVAVVTAATPAQPGAPPESSFRGMTVSSFNTVALSPTPLISFNVKLPSATYSALGESGGVFLVHLLRSSEAGARICDVFAKGNLESASAFQRLATSSVKGQGQGQEEGVQIFSGAGTQGSPLLAGQGVMRVLRCRALPGKEIRVNDHVVLVAEVLGILAAPNAGSRKLSWQENKESGHEMGLVYADRAYRSVGEEIALRQPAETAVDAQESQQSDQGHVQQTIGLNVRRGDEY